jgi:putative SOS response-associated peptidase YedK
MPVILEPAQFGSWLDGSSGLEILRPAGNDVLELCPVSRRVNISHTNDEDSRLIKPVNLAA